MKITENKIRQLIYESVLKEMSNPNRPRKLKLKHLGIPHRLEPNPGNRGDMALFDAAITLSRQFGQPVDRALIDAQTNQEITRYYQNNPHYNSPNRHVYGGDVYSRTILPPFGDTVFRMINGRIRDISQYENAELVRRRLRQGEIYPSFYDSLRAQGIKGQAFRDAEAKIIEGLGKLARHRIRLLLSARDLLDRSLYNNITELMPGRTDPGEYKSDWLIDMQQILYEYGISYDMP